MKVKLPRYRVFPALHDGDGRNWIVRDTRGFEKPEEGRIIKPFRGLGCALNFARRLNKGLDVTVKLNYTRFWLRGDIDG